MDECDIRRPWSLPLQASLRDAELIGIGDTIFERDAVVRLLRARLNTGDGRFRIFHALAEHEAEGMRFLRAARILPRAVCGDWNRIEHLRDESRHMKYFLSLARRETDNVPPIEVAPLNPSELSVFENPQNFFINLYASELFSAAYLQALCSALRNDPSGTIARVLQRAMRDETKHAKWVRSTIHADEDTIRARTRASWRDLEIGTLEKLVLAPHANSDPGDG